MEGLDVVVCWERGEKGNGSGRGRSGSMPGGRKVRRGQRVAYARQNGGNGAGMAARSNEFIARMGVFRPVPMRFGAGALL
eukprot:4196330-Pleurochrysis_carterae.AAC.1